MRIMLITLYYYPDIGGTPGVYKDLCESLCSMGHDVVVVTGFPRYNVTHVDKRYRNSLFLTEKINGVKVRRIKTISLPRHAPAARAIEYFLTAIALFFRALFIKRADIALINSPIFFEGLGGIILRKFKRMPFVLSVHDIFPQPAIDLGILTNRTLIKCFQKLEHYLYRNSDWVTVHSDGNRDWIETHGGSLNRTSVMPIWMNIETLKPGPRENAWRQSQALNDCFVVLSSGTQGYSLDIRVILKAAEHLRNYHGIRFVIVGDGPQHDEMVELSTRMKLSNVLWLDWQPTEQYPMVQHTADVVLATLDEKVKTPLVPSKILSAMSAGRPVITCVPLDGDAAMLVTDANSGINLPPGDDSALAEAILKLYKDRALAEQLGTNGRCYVEQYLNVNRWAESHIELFSKLIHFDEKA